MRAVVLVGGFGTRLRPLTLERPKQLLPVAGPSMLERVVARLAASGVEDVVLSLGYQPDAFIDTFPNGTCAGVRLQYAVEPEPLDTAGAIRFAADAAGIEDRFLALNGDVLTDLDVADLWRAHAKFGAEATIALTPVEDPSRYGVVPLDADGRVEAFIEKPDPGTAPSNWINAGSYVLEPAVLDLIGPVGERASMERQVFGELVDRGTLFGLQSDSYWIDAGTPASYLRANLDVIDGIRGTFEEGIDRSARLDPTARVGRSVVGAGARLDVDVEVVDSVIMAGVRVGAGSSVHNSIIGPRSVLGTGCRLTNLAVVGADTEVRPGSVLDGVSAPPPEEWPA